ncbi:prepilin-type N-terminal cleavage/methylation domain-containing protein [Actinoplanes bogorensis]|uniref:Prepilin-type N-terminal cleavage/methylation domain-containing protein n=1 Tax=Paractinoplanes bogorensis TaxID=1610840 RepID=A0ABS5Z6C4_9ACTN|nr:prepilin-type N-terminal cleavage/methylation domain-containing protein [Actinoplanes bogorensis]MBU2670489.1 prepilin-type N-terminal cleavage/methylation domain-containing protein [Actinoplanes bogorensis]
MHDVINRLRNKKDDEGFTLIELLVVVVIIGVLVAIAVPVYLNYRKGAADKSAQSDLRGAVSTIEQWYTDNGNSYPTATTLKNQAASFSLNTSGGTAGSAGWITLSDKSVLTYIPTVTGTAPNQTASSYLICSTNSGGSGKVYAYDSSVGGSVKALTSATPSMTSCT